MARQVLENGVILPAEYSDDWYDDMTSNLTKLDDVIGSDSEKLSSADVGAAALSNNYNDLDNKPTIPTVNDATLTIQKNGVDVQTFTANASSNVTANITVPTKTSDLTNDSNFVDTSNSAVSSGITSDKVADYDDHIADTDIHVTTVDKDRWDNNTYVFRYSSTALVDSSTNSNALLDNTDNLKVGDKVIDSSGVLFSITAIDTQNSTFTIGTALIDLAQDSDVVHTSGDETSTGFKQFANIRVTNSIKGINLEGTTTDLNNCYSDFAPYTENRGGNIQYYYCTTDSGTANISNLPEAGPFFLTSITTRLISKSLYVKQILTNSNSKTFTRYCANYTWSSWVNETDSEYVHKSGNESISGVKAFVSPVTFSNWTLWNNPNVIKGTIPQTSLTPYRLYFGNGSNYANSLFNIDTSVSNTGVQTLTFRSAENVVNGGGDTRLRITYDPSLTQPRCIRFTGDCVPSADNTYECGTNSNKWKTFNGLNPSSLSMPDLSNGIDISSYITDLVGSPNIYSPPANGYIVLRSTTANVLGIIENTTGMGSYSRGSNQTLAVNLPVVKNSSISIYAICSSLTHAKFIPCQGNV